MIIANQSGYKELPLQVMSNNKNVISFPQKYLTKIKLFRTQSHRMGSSNVSSMDDTLKEAT